MKKKLLLALIMVATLMCMLAIVSSAETIDGIEYTLYPQIYFHHLD